MSGSEKNVQELLSEFSRLVISYNDFKQAHEISAYMIDEGLHQDYPKEDRMLVHALNLAVIVAYSRPFTHNRGVGADARISREILDILSEEERSLHETIINDRNTMMAHSDADANDCCPVAINNGGKKTVFPRNASPYTTPLLPDSIEALAELSFKLQEEVFARRMAIEPQIIDHLPVVKLEGKEDDA